MNSLQLPPGGRQGNITEMQHPCICFSQVRLSHWDSALKGMTDLIRNFMARDFTEQPAGLVAALVNTGKETCRNMVHKMCFQVGQEAFDQEHGCSLRLRQQRCIIHPVRCCLKKMELPWTPKTSRITNWLSQPCTDSGGGISPATCTQWCGSLLGPCTVG